MKYLIDTNIWLEILLEQEKSEEAFDFLSKVDSIYLAMSDFSLHSIILILTKLKEFETANMFLDDITTSGVNILAIEPNDLYKVIDIIKNFNIDLDDAYQYYLSKKYNLILVSFDKDFDKTDIKRKTPKEIIGEP
ncbi:type II toxin-antitoxin system VapC family toxin [Venenivibrio stagnispumantis]|uniref:Predicted nucleic acid-binding protein, contains PIN domain n=1 Tax=Venenivibrio stagnispumantis TaxID=407998 RepID=A0AA46ADS1_9AQUI|nr:PIN domain-containing protein [Venenivibrio stagnispumantis]MCW4573062.1 PIN domain-containing protein [Venenivibrio stagnispumantis]SMP07176.1 Predicted nucleic acid-binding protein, contains PIN domain [Venenivibrio stagnispumantis]